MKVAFIPALLFIAFLSRAQSPETDPATKIAAYDGVKEIFPASWLGGKIKAKATLPDMTRFAADTTAVINAMYKYPVSVWGSELNVVYIVGKLRFNREYFTGTNSENIVYIGTDGNNEIEKTFHHEFSSILLRNHPDMLFEYKWKELSPELLAGNSAAAVKAGLYSVDYDPKLLEKGYLSPYSLSNWENDFNMYAENIFAGGARFWKIADAYPRVMAKVKLIVQFYTEHVWSGFTENFFRAAAE
ncbi:MAG: hypothetical protein U0U70_13115 [Chitinophagaceae bacterium]